MVAQKWRLKLFINSMIVEPQIWGGLVRRADLSAIDSHAIEVCMSRGMQRTSRPRSFQVSFHVFIFGLRRLPCGLVRPGHLRGFTAPEAAAEVIGRRP